MVVELVRFIKVRSVGERLWPTFSLKVKSSAWLEKKPNALPVRAGGLVSSVHLMPAPPSRALAPDVTPEPIEKSFTAYSRSLVCCGARLPSVQVKPPLEDVSVSPLLVSPSKLKALSESDATAWVKWMFTLPSGVFRTPSVGGKMNAMTATGLYAAESEKSQPLLTCVLCYPVMEPYV